MLLAAALLKIARLGALAGHTLLQQVVERSVLSHAIFKVAPTKIPTSSADV